MNQPDFTMDIDHNEYLSEGARDIKAILTVTMVGTAPESPAGKRIPPRSSSSTAPGL